MVSLGVVITVGNRKNHLGSMAVIGRSQQVDKVQHKVSVEHG